MGWVYGAARKCLRRKRLGGGGLAQEGLHSDARVVNDVKQAVVSVVGGPWPAVVNRCQRHANTESCPRVRLSGGRSQPPSKTPTRTPVTGGQRAGQLSAARPGRPWEGGRDGFAQQLAQKPRRPSTGRRVPCFRGLSRAYPQCRSRRGPESMPPTQATRTGPRKLQMHAILVRESENARPAAPRPRSLAGAAFRPPPSVPCGILRRVVPLPPLREENAGPAVPNSSGVG